MESAQQEFLENGFSGASLRRIASNAGVTTGALYRHFKDKAALFDELVSPCFNQCVQLLNGDANNFVETIDRYDFDQNWAGSEENLMELVRYIYDNLDTFRLLLSSAEKTAYENFVHKLIDMEVDMTLEYLEEAQRLGFPVRTVSAEEIHLFANAQFSAFFELVLHNVPRERALNYTRDIYRYFAAGWKTLFVAE